jgi:phage repressor protein C with HTH and peptisase S24 domain
MKTDPLMPRRIIPITLAAPEPALDEGGCGSGESFALRVMGDSMLPEFSDGDIVVIEPEGRVRAGAFVLAQTTEGWSLGQLVGGEAPEPAWRLQSLNPAYPDFELPSLEAVAGVVIQKVRPGRRKLTRWYVD